MKYPPNHILGSQRNGLNHVSMNLGGFDSNLGPIRDTNYPTYSDMLLDWYQAKNVNLVRLMFTWEAIQSDLFGSAPTTKDGYSN